MFNKEFARKVMDLYGVNQLLVDGDGNVYAPNPAGAHTLIAGLQFDTDTADGTVLREALDKAKT